MSLHESAFYIDFRKLDECLDKFYEFVADKQNSGCYPTTEISFMSGYIYEQEGYKYKVFAEAQKALCLSTWDESMIGTGKIIDCVLAAMRVRVDHFQQNLLNWRYIDNIQHVFHGDKAHAEDILYRLYKTNDHDDLIFEESCKAWGRKYPLLSYLFFIKDRNQYLVVRPDMFIKRLETLGVHTTALNKCTWNNYSDFLDIVRTVQMKLQETMNEEVTLLDSHSFIWMMHIFGTVHISDTGRIIRANPDPLVTVVAEGAREGRRIVYYGRKYERNPRNRKAAIRIHGLTCMACGLNFEEKYGELGQGFIEVHHVKPLNSLDEEIVVNPETDLVCLCSNCHSMIHRKKNYIMSLDELREVLEKKQNN